MACWKLAPGLQIGRLLAHADGDLRPVAPPRAPARPAPDRAVVSSPRRRRSPAAIGLHQRAKAERPGLPLQGFRSGGRWAGSRSADVEREPAGPAKAQAGQAQQGFALADAAAQKLLNTLPCTRFCASRIAFSLAISSAHRRAVPREGDVEPSYDSSLPRSAKGRGHRPPMARPAAATPCAAAA